MIMTKRTIFSVGILVGVAALGAACVTEIPAVGGASGAGGASTGEVGTPAVAQTTGSISVGAGGTGQSQCGFFADLASCSVDDTTPDTIDQAGATNAIVGTWRRCDDTESGFFDVGVRFQPDGRTYRLYRKPNDLGGSSENLVYCGSDMSDSGTWSLNDKSAEGLPDEYDLTIAWDNGDATTFDVELYGNQAALGLFDTPDSTDPELFAHEGPQL
jgi:hypothetical protein